MKIDGNEIRPGNVIEHQGRLWRAIKTQHVKPGKGGAFAQVEMKSVNKNTKLNERFRSSDTVEKASLEEEKLNYLYSDESKFYFINQKTFEQIEVSKNILGDKGNFLTENLEVIILFYNDKPLTISLPNQVKGKIKETEMALKGQTVSSSYKPAILENGVKILVPPFIESGDEILIDTRSIEYIKKV